VLSLLLRRILLRIIGSLPLIWEWSADHSQITPQMRILVAVEAVDGRKGIDSLARLCQEKLQTDPFLCGGPRYVAGMQGEGPHTRRSG
jgi:hypothetical protein